jgi:hypothetical protein
MVDNSLYYIYIDATDGTLSSSTIGWTLDDTKVPVATVYWNNTLTPKFIMAEERHTCLIDRRQHYHEHFTDGTRYVSGGTISGMTINSSTPADKTFGITAANIMDEDIVMQLSALTDPDGATAVYYNLYRTSVTSGPTLAKWDWVASDMPFKYSTAGGPVYGRLEYDLNGTSTPASANNRFVNTYLIACNVVGNSEANPNISTDAKRYLMLQGRAEFTTTATAYAEDFSTFDLSGLPMMEVVGMYQFTWDTSTIANTVKGRCQLNRQPVRIKGNFISSTVSVADSSAETTNTIGALINSANSKTTPVDADMLAMMDSEASNIMVKFSWTNLKTALKTYLDSLTTTFTNKRITSRVTSLTSSATPTVDSDATDLVDITALATAITNMSTNFSGTPTNGQKIMFRIKDDGTARAISWGTNFVAGGVALPTTTVLSKILTVGFMYNTANSLNKWMCIASAQEV